jgi:dTDP-4-dehydrorhamnose 3,5-epimerase-like enzyme
MAKLFKSGIMNTLDNVVQIEIPSLKDPRGSLAIIEGEVLPFSVERVYYLYDVPSDAYRGGHAHKSLVQCLVALSGSFEVLVDDGLNQRRIMLNKPDIGLLIPSGIWRELDNFSSGSVCLVLASEVFDESDYIRDYNEFKDSKI